MIMTQGETDSPVRSYSVPWYAPKAAIVLGIVVLILLLVTSTLFIYYYSESRAVDDLRAQLATANSAMKRMDALQTELGYHREFTRRIAGLVGISVPNFADSALVATTTPSGSVLSADTFDLDDHSHGEEIDMGTVGVLVTDCPPDPNNRPRGMPLSGRVSRGFAPRQSNPSLRHSGIDFAVREGTPVLATADGVVEFAGEHDVYGLLITIDHGNGFKTTYGHNSLLLLRQGEKVQRGDRIASSGNTGISTAPHLHYEITENGTPVDPVGFFGQ